MNRLSSFQKLFRAAESLIDDRVGVVRYVRELPREAGGPEFFHYYAQACNTVAFCEQRNFANAGGASTDRNLAVAKALGEAVERYCSAIYDRDQFPLTSFDAAPFQCMHPDNFALYCREQYKSANFRFVPFEYNTAIRWAATTDFLSDETWYVPAAMVVLPYSYDLSNSEFPIGQSISTGLACHCSFAEAAVAAICEVIERDAFTITWQAGLAPPQISIDTLSEQNHELVRRFETTGSSITLFNLLTDHRVPAILAALRGKNLESPALVFAASADMNPERAVRKALEELAHTRRLAQQLKSGQPDISPTANFANIRNQDDHVALYANHSNASLADFIFSSETRIDFHEIGNLSTSCPESDLKTIIDMIKRVNHQVLLADLTTIDIRGFFCVVRAIIPGFHPLFFGHPFRALGGTRLWNVPQMLGYEGIRRPNGDNPVPHPYP